MRGHDHRGRAAAGTPPARPAAPCSETVRTSGSPPPPGEPAAAASDRRTARSPDPDVDRPVGRCGGRHHGRRGATHAQFRCQLPIPCSGRQAPACGRLVGARREPPGGRAGPRLHGYRDGARRSALARCAVHVHTGRRSAGPRPRVAGPAPVGGGRRRDLIGSRAVVRWQLAHRRAVAAGARRPLHHAAVDRFFGSPAIRLASPVAMRPWNAPHCRPAAASPAVSRRKRGSRRRVGAVSGPGGWPRALRSVP